MTAARPTLAVLLLTLAGAAHADPPAGYYDSVTGTTGPTIKAQLTSIANVAISRSYNDARNILQVTDEDQSNPANIILTYNGASITSTWTSGSTWNREHCWPRSLGVGDSGPDYSDLHQLRPCNPSINGSRGNKQFGTGGSQWDPDRYGLQFRGEMARIVFYMNTRYTYLNIPTIGSQTQFVDWHFDQMPDDDDRRRNDSVYVYQQNRNPFVDHPEWVWAVYGDSDSDAQLAISGQSATDGATSLSIDLGTMIDSGSPQSFDIQLDKSGAAPTTYLVSASGDLSSPADTGFQAGFARGSQSVMLPVTLAGGAGMLSGTLTIDNTEVTSAAAGQGSADGDDTVTVTALSLAPSIASLDDASLSTSRTIDFGTVTMGDTVAPIDVQIWNLAGGSFASALDIDSVMITGGTGDIGLLGAPIVGVAGGGNAALSAVLTPTVEGDFIATATITVSDEDVLGETTDSLTVTFTGTVADACPADVNGDGQITPQDFPAWILAYNTGAPECDQNGDNTCNPQDFPAFILNLNNGCD